MRSTCIRMHPPEYCPHETEQFYETMAQKGWFLEKRDTYWSTFRKGAPQPLRYRLEYCGAYTLPTDQLSLYEECGWTIAARCRNVFVFVSSECNPCPELYNSSIQQADSVQGLGRQTPPFLSVATVRLAFFFPILLFALIAALLTSDLPEVLLPSFLCIFFGFCLLLFGHIVLNVRFSMGYRRLYQHLSNGDVSTVSHTSRYLMWRIILICIFALGILLILLGLLTALLVSFGSLY